MMGYYDELYKTGPSATDVKSIKETFCTRSDIASWEEYYWAAKCIVDFDSAGFSDADAELLAEMLNNSIRHGLSYRANKRCYLEVMKMLSSIYSIQDQHDLASNCLGSILALDDEAPDWVYHELVSAQNKTDYIQKNLKYPKKFLEMLSRDDSNDPFTRNKQANIFKEFLVAGAAFLSENPEFKADYDTVQAAAAEYGLVHSEEWKEFTKICTGSFPQEPKEQNQIVPPESTREWQKPDDTEYDKKYAELLAEMASKQAELEKKEKELEDAGASIKELATANAALNATIKSDQEDIATYISELTAKNQRIAELEKLLHSKKAEPDESKRLQQELKTAQERLEAEGEQKVKLKGNLRLATEQILSQNDRIRTLEEENKTLTAQTLFVGKRADILSKCKAFEVIITEKLAEWLTNNLKDGENWWRERVMKALPHESALKVQDCHFSKLQEFDLALLLRVFSGNRERLGRTIFVLDGKNILQEMIEVRNRLAHSDAMPISVPDILNDLRVMSLLLMTINAEEESKMVSAYATCLEQ